MQLALLYFAITNILPCFSQSSYHWGAWSAWPIVCSKTCGEGERCRTRKCQDGFGASVEDSSCSGSSEECMTCMVSAKCPHMPGWSDWGEWGECILSETGKKTKPDKHGCRPGTKIRTRLCNNPPPEPGPNSPICLGVSQEVTKCKYGCPDTPQLSESDVRKQIEQKIISDHLPTRVMRKHPKDFADAVLIRVPGDSAVLSCRTSAYSFAQDLLQSKTEDLVGTQLPTLKAEVFWQLGGRVIASENEGILIRDARLTAPDKVIEEEDKRWLKEMERTTPVTKGPELILNNLHPHDTGFYTCHVKIGKHEWMVIFYSLIVLGQQFSAPAKMPFYFHSNIGGRNPFHRGNIHWYDAARIQWTLNGEVKFTDLVARPRARIKLIPHLGIELQGHWECYLIVPLSDSPTSVGSKNFTPSGRFLINSFFLRVTESPQSLWELADRPSGIATMRYVAVIAMFITALLLILFILTVWAIWRWVRRTPNINRLKGEVERVIEDRTNLFLRAAVVVNERKKILVPFVRLENREIEKERWNAEQIPAESAAAKVAQCKADLQKASSSGKIKSAIMGIIKKMKKKRPESQTTEAAQPENRTQNPKSSH
ncbi:hypothetical protein Aperf_G00000055017 [Anoplocephala perfoliata]